MSLLGDRASGGRAVRSPGGLFLRTPSSITPLISRFCAEIAPVRQPVYLRIAPGPDATPLSCFDNVQRRMDREGGACQFGWTIWIWPGVLIEAEHHAVYAPSPGVLHDVTPGAAGVKRRLFLADDAAVYDPSAPSVRRDNVRRVLTDDPLMAEILAGAAARTRIWQGSAATGQGEPGALEGAQLNQVYAQLKLGLSTTAPNARCFCGSGKRMKRCHGTRA